MTARKPFDTGAMITGLALVTAEVKAFRALYHVHHFILSKIDGEFVLLFDGGDGVEIKHKGPDLLSVMTALAVEVEKHYSPEAVSKRLTAEMERLANDVPKRSHPPK